MEVLEMSHGEEVDIFDNPQAVAALIRETMADDDVDDPLLDSYQCFKRTKLGVSRGHGKQEDLDGEGGQRR